jgi:hypothetical protein
MGSFAGVQDAGWSTACCAPDMDGSAQICARYSALLWKCLPSSMVNTAAYAATNPQVQGPHSACKILPHLSMLPTCSLTPLASCMLSNPSAAAEHAPMLHCCP